jgi:hypothetical protein
MIEQERPEVFGHTLVCDDVRQETTGKLIYIGVYHGIMYVQGSFPITLPRLCFSIDLAQKLEAFSPKIKLQIFVPGDSADNASIQAEMGEKPGAEGAFQRAADVEAAGIPDADKKYLTIFSTLMFENFLLQGEGIIKVRADINGKRYDLGGLRVSKAPQQGAI